MQTLSPLDGYRKQIEAYLTEGRSYRQIASLIGIESQLVTSERSIRRAVRRWGLSTTQSRPQGARPERESFTLEGDRAEFTTAPSPDLDDIDALIRERGLDPEEWEIHDVTVNKWDSAGEPQRQLKVHLRRIKHMSMVVPARVALGKLFRSVAHRAQDDEPELVVFVGDQHAPYHDTELHKRFCEFLCAQAPERTVLMGDLIDLPTISRHPPEPEWAASTQECLDAGGQIILDYREANPDSTIVKLPGNHLERLRRSIIDRLGDWYDLTPAQLEGHPELPPIYDPAYLLRLDELGVEYIRPVASYHHAQYMVTPYLAAKHGDVARKGSGVSALITLQGLDHSVIQGHSHRQSLVQRTIQQIDGTGRLLQAGETGCMCRIQHGLGYAPGPDWSNGFITAAVWPDSTFKLDLATFVDSKLYWRSERY